MPSRNEHTSKRVASIASKLLRACESSSLEIRIYGFVNNRQHIWRFMPEDVASVAASCLTQTADKSPSLSQSSTKTPRKPRKSYRETKAPSRKRATTRRT